MQKTVDSMGNSLDLVFAEACELLLRDALGPFIKDYRLAARAILAHPLSTSFPRFSVELLRVVADGNGPTTFHETMVVQTAAAAVLGPIPDDWVSLCKTPPTSKTCELEKGE